MKSKNFKFCCAFVTLFISIFLLSCGNESVTTLSDNISTKTAATNTSIVLVGDILMHGPQITSGYDSQKNTYNYDDFFKYVKDYISNADLAVCNSETSYLGANSKYSGYPCFNSPTELLDSLKSSGFDIVNSAHNHTLDMGIQGFNNTAKAITEKGFDLLGIKNSKQDKDYIVKDVNGIKVGITNFTYSTYDQQGILTLNGIPIPNEVKNRINTFSEKDIKTDLNKINTIYNQMKSDGAEYTIFYIHWGNEYQKSPSKFQEDFAKDLNSIGIDMIAGSHPHVVQPVRSIKNNTSNKETLVCYSLGNFISNQRQETMGNVRSEDGLMVKLNLFKDENGIVSLSSYETEPTWVYKYDSNGKSHFNIIPLKSILEDNSDKSAFSNSIVNKMKDSYNATEHTINN